MIREWKSTITMKEFTEGKLAYVNNIIYNNIESAFISTLGERVGKKILAKHLESSLQELSCNSFVNIMDCFIVK